MDPTSLFTALSSFNSTVGAAKAALEIRDVNAAATAVAKANKELIDLQAQVFAMNQAAAELQQANFNLTKQVRELEDQRAERERYSLFEIVPAVFVYRLNLPPHGAAGQGQSVREPLHYLCQSCLDNRRMKVILQNYTVGGMHCPECKHQFWLRDDDPEPPRSRYADM